VDQQLQIHPGATPGKLVQESGCWIAQLLENSFEVFAFCFGYDDSLAIRLARPKPDDVGAPGVPQLKLASNRPFTMHDRVPAGRQILDQAFF
jgi:hypothetical protein